MKVCETASIFNRPASLCMTTFATSLGIALVLWGLVFPAMSMAQPARRGDAGLEQLSRLEEGQRQLGERLTRMEEGQRQLGERLARLEEGQRQLGERLTQMEEGQRQLWEGQRHLGERFVRVEEGQRQLGARFDNLWTLVLTGFGVLLSGMFALVGFVIWDRRSALAPAVRRVEELREREERLEAVLKEYARRSPELAEALKKMGLL
jgi:DNA repair exonuclease SbcCD ATPase subunit